MARFDNSVIERIREETDIVELISQYVQLRQAGRNYQGLCPFHSEKTPSFSVSEDKKIFKCFGCGESGDAISFLMKIESCDFLTAVQILAKRLGILLREETEEDKIRKERRENLYKLNREVALFFMENLRKSKKAIDYIKKREIPGKIANQFGLGYANDSYDKLINFLNKKSFPLDLAESLGLIATSKKGNKYDYFRDRLMFPIIDTKGRVIGFGGRSLGDNEPKYLNSKENEIFHKGENLYSLNLVRKNNNDRKIILVEGYMDVIALFKKGIKYGVASLGTALTERQARLISKNADDIYICFDTDSSGIKATMRALDIFSNDSIEVGIISLGKYKDPDDYFHDNSLEDFKLLMDNAKTSYEFRLDYLKSKYDIEKPEEKIKLVKEFLHDIANYKNPIEREVYQRKLSEDLNVAYETIKSNDVGPIRRYDKRFIISTSSEIKDSIDFELLKLSIIDREFFEKMHPFLESYDFKDDRCKDIYANIVKFYEEKLDDKNLLYKDIIEIHSSDKNFSKNLIYNNKGFLSLEPEEMFESIKKVIEIRRLREKREGILLKMSENQDGGNVSLNDLFLELDEINQKLIAFGEGDFD
ncbi:MAG: DNA primase [Tissierellia bacterium]|nr:DNA primase [Tissierellia bacterium]